MDEIHVASWALVADANRTMTAPRVVRGRPLAALDLEVRTGHADITFIPFGWQYDHLLEDQ